MITVLSMYVVAAIGIYTNINLWSRKFLGKWEHHLESCTWFGTEENFHFLLAFS